nr:MULTISPECIES: hydrolase [unclassified Facklamia]
MDYNELERNVSELNVSGYEAISTEIDENNQSVLVFSDRQANIGKKSAPKFESKLRTRIVEVPKEIYEASGIEIFGKRIKSLLFSTDVAIIRNSNAQSVIAVYPFTPLATIMQSIVSIASVPVFVGVGGGTTTGSRSVYLAIQAEQMGAYGVVVNAPMENSVIKEISMNIDIPLIATVSSFNDDFLGKISAGATMLNVSGGARTAELVAHIRSEIGDAFPIIATGGSTPEQIRQTIQAGANAITYTPPTSAEIFAELMKKYRGE